NGPGLVATEAERKKRSKYACLTPTYHFIPVAVETFGALGEDAGDFVKALGKSISAVTGEKRSTEFLLQRLSVAIQRGNASCVLGTLDTNSQDLEVVFYLQCLLLMHFIIMCIQRCYNGRRLTFPWPRGGGKITPRP